MTIAKAVAGNELHLQSWPGVLMCIVLGIIAGRLSGIGWRVRQLKNRHGFRASHQEPGAGRENTVQVIGYAGLRSRPRRARPE